MIWKRGLCVWSDQQKENYIIITILAVHNNTVWTPNSWRSSFCERQGRGTLYVMICRLNTINLYHHQTQLSHHSLHCSPGSLERNLTDHVIIIAGIRAVTLAGGAGVNCRTTVRGGMAPVSTLKGHKDCIDLHCTLGHTLTFLMHGCSCLYLFGLFGLFYEWNRLWEKSRKRRWKVCVRVWRLRQEGFEAPPHNAQFGFQGVSWCQRPILWKRDDVHSVEGEVHQWESVVIYSWC